MWETSVKLFNKNIKNKYFHLKRSYLQCKKCRLTYYCDEEHQEIDFNGIHDKICQLIIPLRTPVTFGSEEERANELKATRQRQLKLLEVPYKCKNSKTFGFFYRLQKLKRTKSFLSQK